MLLTFVLAVTTAQAVPGQAVAYIVTMSLEGDRVAGLGSAGEQPEGPANSGKSPDAPLRHADLRGRPRTRPQVGQGHVRIPRGA